MRVLIISANTVPSAPSGPAYVAGAALESGYAVAGDRLARLSLNTVGLGKREWSVFGLCRGARLPVAAVMADVYGRQIEEEVVLTSLINEVAAVPGGMCKHLEAVGQSSVARVLRDEACDPGSSIS